jgi:hypothetical protein
MRIPIWTVALLANALLLTIVHGLHTYTLYNPGNLLFADVVRSSFALLLWVAPNQLYLIVPVLRAQGLISTPDPVQGEIFGSLLFLFLAVPAAMLSGRMLTAVALKTNNLLSIAAYAVMSIVGYLFCLSLISEMQGS